MNVHRSSHKVSCIRVAL